MGWEHMEYGIGMERAHIQRQAQIERDRRAQLLQARQEEDFKGMAYLERQRVLRQLQEEPQSGMNNCTSAGYIESEPSTLLGKLRKEINDFTEGVLA